MHGYHPGRERLRNSYFASIEVVFFFKIKQLAIFRTFVPGIICCIDGNSFMWPRGVLVNDGTAFCGWVG